MKLIKTAFHLFSSMNIVTLFRLFLDLLQSKIFFPNARIIRRPNYIRNEGSLIMGKGFSCGPGLIVDIFGSDAKVQIGKGVMAYHNLHIGAIDSVTIGDDVLIASGVYISDHSHGDYSSNNLQSSPLTPPVARPLASKPIVIGDNVWIGERVVILPGVSVGKGSIIGAGSVVTKNIPSYTIAAGSPAKPTKVFDFDNKVWVPV